MFSRPVYPSPPLRWWGERALGGRVLMHNSLTICAFEVAAGLDLWLWNDGGAAGGVRYRYQFYLRLKKNEF